MKKKLLFLFICTTFFCQAQPGKEANHWYFGHRAKLDFSSGSPVGSIGPSTFYTNGSSASISDPNTGQYLFSIGNTRIYNKNDAVMSNGYNILSGQYCTQAALIVPKPDSANIFYVVTADGASANNAGVHYSVVDMSKQNGLGAVTIKNQVLTPPPCTEKLTAVRHCNGKDFWILTHPGNTNCFNAYLVTSAGINLTPVVSCTGTVHQHVSGDINYTSYWGYLKGSPNGKSLALTIDSYYLPITELFDFDNSTGVVSNPITLNYPGTLGAFGLSFSPDNTKLYMIGGDSIASRLYQYDVTNYNLAAILASQSILAQKPQYYSFGGNNSAFGGMQMAPDGKIYIANWASDTLSVINYPNLPGNGCAFQYTGFLLPASSLAMGGFINCIDGNYAGIQLDLSDVKQCTSFKPDTLNVGAGYAGYSWSTGAGTQTIVVNNPGTYWVTVTNAQGCTRTDTVRAYLITPGTKTVSACVTDTMNTMQSVVLSYSWSDGTMNPVKTFTASGVYWEDVSFIGGCKVRDTFVVNINPSPALDLGRDTAFCKGDLKLNAYYPSSTYKWNTGETTPGIHVTRSGTYFVKVVSPYGCVNSDTLVVNPELASFNFSMPNIVTPNGDNLNDEIDFSIFQFSSLKMTIYNRWGNEIFRTDDPNAIWKPVTDDGTYFWTMDYRIDCGSETKAKSDKGFITVLR